ncbi:hypothetical protein BAE44_0006642 [Dichanthelium oligosanthes]|uniref:UDENN domain-containing protein n=1 Tax=Dichanthelium oligosanthes TaxID=888268 RepID=A0A1E5W4U9_9POAL|nr:hypothetical protein BAE44_0006642 [Dichanthelium oligosanthes]
MVDKNDGSEGLKFNTSHLIQTTEEVARAFITAASAATAQSARPSVVYSSKDESGSPMQKLQQQFSKIMKGFSSSPDLSGPYNPEVLTTQKRQWARFQLKSLGDRCIRDPSHLFESIVIVGLPPQADIHELENIALGRNDEDGRRSRNLFGNSHQVHAISNLEPQVLFAYPPEKPLPLKYKDTLSFCLPGGVQVCHIQATCKFSFDSLEITECNWYPSLPFVFVGKHMRANRLRLSYVRAVERTPSFSELNEILLGQSYNLHYPFQEQLKESNQSFVFRLQVADDSTLYGCCVLVEEIVQRPSKLVSMLMNEKPVFPRRSRYVITTPRCYCILSRLPFFELHFGVLQSILMEERLEWLTDGVSMLTSLSLEEACEENDICEATEVTAQKQYLDGNTTDVDKSSESSTGVSSKELSDTDSSSGCKETQLDFVSKEGQQQDSSCAKEQGDLEIDTVTHCDTPEVSDHCIPEDTSSDQSGVKHHELDSAPDIQNESGARNNCDDSPLGNADDEQLDLFITDTILPLMRSRICDDCESSPSSQDSPSEGRNFRSDTQESDSEEPSSIGHGDLVRHNNILQWAKAKKYGSLQVVCQYYQLKCPARGSPLTFHPLEHLHPLSFHRPGETVLHIAGSTIELRSRDTSLEVAEVRNALFGEEESTALSTWAVASICGCLRLEHVMTLFAAALLEKQILIVCSNLGMLSASVLSIIPLIRPYQWQSLLIPVLPIDMMDFLDAPVPYIVGVQNKTSDVLNRLPNAVVIDANRNQIKSSSVPQLPQHRELLSSLRPYHSILVGESYLARKRPVYECTDAQVSLLLRESFIGSFPSRDRPFMKVLNCIPCLG